MTKGFIPIVLAALLVCAGCAVRMGSAPAEATPAGVPRSTPRNAPSQPAAPDRPVVGSGSESALAAPTAGPASAPSSDAPAATASAYIFSPQQAVSARPSSSPPSNALPERQDESSGTPRGELQLVVVASAPELATGAIMTADVMAKSRSAVVDAPLHLNFDPNVVAFVDAAPGDFLTQGGSSIVFLADGQSRPGDVAVAAGRVEREQGASGAGLLCRVRLRGLRVGTTPVLVGQAKAWGTKGEELTVLSGGTTVVVH